MEKNIRKKLGNNKGITLVALVVTIIVLLILAGVALSSVLSQDGIFSRAEQATDKHGQAKARETLELAIGEAQMKKYEEGLTDEELDNQIGKIQGELLPKEKPENPNLQNVIVDGYIFEIDRSVPKIVDYIGKANGVIITASISGNNGWQKPDNATVTITGTIKTYSGGTITSSSATATNGVTIPADFPTTGGNYTIEVVQDTTITITAKDSNNKENSKTIPVTIKVDGTVPTVETVTAVAEEMKIKISATGHDKNLNGKEESGINHFEYRIEPDIGIDKPTGIIQLGQEIIVETTEETTYIIKVTAIDNVGNGPSIEKTAIVKIEMPSATKQTALDGEWWIPKDFIEAEDSSPTIQGGKVIEDRYGNQWVWIPCYLENSEGRKIGQEMYSNATEYKRTDFGVGFNFGSCKEELETNDSECVKKYGGFYIGRYEAGADDDNNVVIQKNQIPYKNIQIETSKTKSNEFANTNNYDTNKVYTKLVSSYAWDTAINFIQKTVSDYAKNSPQGIYNQTLDVNTGLSTPVCNIYDMGGNLWEYTSESCSGGNTSKIRRGGSRGNNASQYPAGSRLDVWSPDVKTYGFRLTLYLSI